jgi:hypothetical protein
VQRKSWKKMDQELVREESLALSRLSVGAMPDEIEQYTSYLVDFTQSLIEKIVPWSQPSSRATPWWTEEIRELV